MKDILDQMEEQIAAIRNLQRNFDFHSKRLEKLMISLNNWNLENNQDDNTDENLQFNKNDDLVKSLKTVTPAEAGVQNSLNLLDSRFRGNDKNGEVATFYETIKNE